MIPTLFGIMLLNFAIVQAAPGGPVEKAIAELEGVQTGAGAFMQGSGGSETLQTSQVDGDSRYQGSKGLPPELIAQLEKMYGFDKPAHERFFIMIKNYAQFDFGSSYFKDKKVTELLAERLPVSISLGLWSTLIIYLVSIPLGIRKAVSHGSRFDAWSSFVIILGYALPSFLFAIFLVVLFAGGSYFQWFPLRGLVSDNFAELSFIGKGLDYLWHITLPTLAMVVGGFATLSMLTKNSFLEEINKAYTITARAKGLNEKEILYKHVFRNAMLIIIAGFPAAFISIFFTGSMLIEYIFSLDGIGLLGFEAVINRDYPIVFGTLFIFTLIGLVVKLISDITYMLVDPRIDFEARQV